MASVSTDAVLVKRKGRRIVKIPRPFPVGRLHILLSLKLSLRVRSLTPTLFICFGGLTEDLTKITLYFAYSKKAEAEN